MLRMKKEELRAFLERRYPGDVDELLKTVYDIREKYDDEQLYILVTVLKRLLGTRLED